MTKGGSSYLRLLGFARKLQAASRISELIELTRIEVTECLGYRHAWLCLATDDSCEEFRLLAVSGDISDQAWAHAPLLTVKGDAMLEQIVASDLPVVVRDAREDPRTDKRIVAELGNRTIVNVPLRLADKPLGALGCGTYGDEGVREPSADDLEYLVGMAGQLSVALSRLQLAELRANAERERVELEHRVMRMQRIESLALLAGGVAHDFNNLLTVVMSGAALIRRRSEDPAILADADAIAEAATRGAELTRHLLAMGRAQALRLEEVDLDERIAKTLPLWRRLFPENIEIEHIPRAQSTLIEGDPTELDQVLLNICVNARDAMPSGGRLTLESEVVLINGRYAETHPWAKPGRYLLVTLTDTGVGMAPEIMERIFEPFFTTKGTSGSGLGLATAFGIVRQHGGMLHVYSEPGVGSSFKIYLPVSARRATDVGTKIVARARGGTERLLVAEDNEAIRDVIQRVLTNAGYAVELARDGAEAVARVEQSTFDLVVLDVVMPGQPCQETVRRLRELAPGLRILLVSGYTADLKIEELTRDPGVALLGKPFDPEQLLRAIRSLLEK
ncbi:MAG: ATP-binding protein [Polyangiaceae bacterium]